MVKVEVKEPVPVPFDVFVEIAMVGLVLVDQTTPLADMEAPPSAVMLPPDVAEVVVITVMAVVVSVGMETMEFKSLRQRTENPYFLVTPLQPNKLELTFSQKLKAPPSSSVALQYKALILILLKLPSMYR